MVKDLPAMWETQVQSLSQEDSPGKGNGYLSQYSCLEKFMDRGSWQATVYVVGSQSVGHHWTTNTSTFTKSLWKFFFFFSFFSRFLGSEDRHLFSLCHSSFISLWFHRLKRPNRNCWLKKKCTRWELWVKFYLGQKEDCSPGDSNFR